jgi:hypothetical protein
LGANLSETANPSLLLCLALFLTTWLLPPDMLYILCFGLSPSFRMAALGEWLLLHSLISPQCLARDNCWNTVY